MIRTLDRLLIVAKRKPLFLAGFRLSNMDIEENLPYFPRFSNKVPKSKGSLSKNYVFAQLHFFSYKYVCTHILFTKRLKGLTMRLIKSSQERSN